MISGAIRRAQLIAPFGVGAMSVLVDGTSVVTCGLDHWFDQPAKGHIEMSEFAIPDWRLQRRLKVSYLCAPPDYRKAQPGTGLAPNLGLSIPALRFPSWSFCPFCKRLGRGPLSMAERPRCPDNSHSNHKRRPMMAQVPFVTICERGHLDDFPWSEWVHQSIDPSCPGLLRLVSRGGGSLAGQVVKCDICDRDRSLQGVTMAGGSASRSHSTVLTDRLAPGEPFPCRGSRPWIDDPGSGCGAPLRAALRGSSNVYFAVVESSIYLPQGQADPELLEILKLPLVATKLKFIRKVRPVFNAEAIREADDEGVLDRFSDEQLDAAATEVFGPPPSESLSTQDDELTDVESWRSREWEVLRAGSTHPDLTVSTTAVAPSLKRHFARVNLVHKLTETRALRGFTRVHDAPLRLADGKALLRKSQPPPERDWLPAYSVSGEGIYIELDPKALERWEARREVQDRVAVLQRRSAAVAAERGTEARLIPPRTILIHTLAHLLINQLIFECGYSSASLRERLYTSDDAAHPMAGLLIYTAAGDSEGTMGGLVRMGNPMTMARIVDKAINRARWCASDPVCMELGESGQGPDSCNMAACHGCALIPETACELFNRLLDRGLVIGTFASPENGYFS